MSPTTVFCYGDIVAKGVGLLLDHDDFAGLLVSTHKSLGISLCEFQPGLKEPLHSVSSHEHQYKEVFSPHVFLT